MEILSDEYGWTPEEILRQDADTLDKYLMIIAIKRYLGEEDVRKLDKKYGNNK